MIGRARFVILAVLGLSGPAMAQEVVRDVARTGTSHFSWASGPLQYVIMSMRACGEDPSPFIDRVVTDLSHTRFINKEAFPGFVEEEIKNRIEQDGGLYCDQYTKRTRMEGFDAAWSIRLAELLRLEAFLEDEATRPLPVFGDTPHMQPPVAEWPKSPTTSPSPGWSYFDAPVAIERTFYDELGEGNLMTGVTISDALDRYDIICTNKTEFGDLLPAVFVRYSDSYFQEISDSASVILSDERGNPWTSLQWAEACQRTGLAP